MTDQLVAGSRRSRSVVALAVAVVAGTLLLLWGANWLARVGAESVLARTLQERTGALEPPVVEVQGGVVLLQALRGRYDDVEVSAEFLSSGPVRVEEFSADLSDVYLSFSDLLHGNTHNVVVGRSAQQAVLTYDDLNRYLDFTGRSPEATPSAEGGIGLAGSVDGPGGPVAVTAPASVGAEDGAVVLEPGELQTDRPLRGLEKLLVVQRFTVRVPMEPLPFGQRITDVAVEPSGLVVRASGSGVVLGS